MRKDHAGMIAEWSGAEIKKKYRAGQIEHGGDVSRKNVMGHAQEEATDIMVYLAVIQEQRAKAIKVLEIAGFCAATDRIKYINMAKNLLEHGNIEGEKEEEKNEVKAQTFDERYEYSINKDVAMEVLNG